LPQIKKVGPKKILAENRLQISGYLLDNPKTENLKKPKAPLLAGLLHNILFLKQYLRLLGGAERATSQTAYVLQGQANQALATQYITLNVETAFSCVHDSN